MAPLIPVPHVDYQPLLPPDKVLRFTTRGCLGINLLEAKQGTGCVLQGDGDDILLPACTGVLQYCLKVHADGCDECGE